MQQLMDKGQRWKGVNGVGVSAAKQQGQRETSLKEKKGNLAMRGERISVQFDEEALTT